MGSHCYTLNYDGSLNGESLPFNDIAITIKLSVPSFNHKQKHKVKIGMKTALVVDEFGNLLDSELESYTEEICIGGPDISSLKKYEDEFNAFFNGKDT